MLSELERTKRIDSEFYKKENLQIVSFIKEKGCNNLTDLVSISDGNHMTISNDFIDKGVPYYRGQDIHDFFIENASPICISEDVFNKPLLNRSHLKKDDILLSIVGTIGKVALVGTKEKATCSCKLAILRPKGKISSELLAIFLNSKYGQNQIQKFVRGAVQMGLILEDMNQLFVPIFNNNFDKKISERVLLSKQTSQQSQSLYTQAEDLLLETIGLKNFKPSKKGINIKRFKESFLVTERLDAEYYLPKYEEIENKVKQNNLVTLLGDVLIKIDTGEYSENYYVNGSMNDLSFYIRSTNIKNGLVEIDNNYFVPKNLFQKISHTGDIVTARVGSVGLFATIRKEISGSMYSDNILCFRLSNEFIPEVYTLLFNSKYYFELIDKMARGSVQQRLNQETLKDLIIPIVDYKIQLQIAELVRESFSLRKESERLLEEAKEMVEREVGK